VKLRNWIENWQQQKKEKLQLPSQIGLVAEPVEMVVVTHEALVDRGLLR